MPPTTPPPGEENSRVIATPLARAMAADLGVDLTTVTGSGRRGRITRSDVEAATTPSGVVGSPAVGGRVGAVDGPAAVGKVGAVDSREQAPSGSATLPHRGPEPGAGSLQAAPTPTQSPTSTPGPGPTPTPTPTPTPGAPGGTREVPLSSMRRVVARRLVESMQSAPHFFLTIRVDVEALAGFRAELNRQLAAGGEDLKVSVNDLVVKACAVLLRANPALNVSFGGDKLIRHRRIHVGVAVAVDGGLIVPVVRDADRKSLTQVAREARDLIGRARTGRLAADETRGGTFTVSNLGMFGVKQFTAVINPPEAAILAVGAAEPEPVVTADGGVVVHQVLRLTLSIDHRALDGATGAQFLAQLKEVLEHPLRIVA